LDFGAYVKEKLLYDLNIYQFFSAFVCCC